MTTRTNTEGNTVQTITVRPGQAIPLPAGRDLRIEGVTGAAYITHTGRDLVLWCGDTMRIAAATARVWGAPVLSALGDKPATVMVETERATGLWQFWTRSNQPATHESVATFWTLWQGRFGDRRKAARPTCR